MLVPNVIKASALTLLFLGSSAAPLHAQVLTAKEQTVCVSLKNCVDITRRHDASEFDYAALDVEFRRFGPAGKAALFALLEGGAEHSDVAQLIAKLGPLTPQDRQRIQAKWSKEKTQAYLPFLLDGHPMSRDLLLQSLDHEAVEVRETVRLALGRLPKTAPTRPISKPVQTALLSALARDPIGEAAPYLARMNPAGHEAQIAALLGSGNTGIVSAAYNALYQRSPAQAFNALLAEMERIETPAQARAIGDMFAVRHRSRADGFYLKFSQDMSGDPKLSVPARASGLHALMAIGQDPVPELTPDRKKALSFLVSTQPFAAQGSYLPYLKKARAEAAMNHIWEVAQTEKWINRDRLSTFFDGQKTSNKVIADLIQSNDVRSFQAGLHAAKPPHQRFIRTQIDSPVSAIASKARQALRLKKPRISNQTCSVNSFDLNDKSAQMPFFKSGWLVSDNKARLPLRRPYLTTAHPTRTGWLAGYDVANSGGTLGHYDNKSGAFKTVGTFSSPLAILPARPVKLGQTTDSFWVVDQWGGDAADVSAYRLELTNGKPRITHIGALPQSARDFAVMPTGDLVVTFADKNQKPIRLSQAGKMTLACSGSQPTNALR